MEKPNNTFSRGVYSRRFHDGQVGTAPERRVDKAVLQKFFQLFNVGNLTEINNYIVHYNITADTITDDSQSVLHLLLINEALTPMQKLSICKFLASRGGLNMNYDANNITPLHLACRYQLEDIVRLLLVNHHEPNALDSSYKSPLHYAVAGKDTVCPPKRVYRDRNFIPDKKEKESLIKDKINNDLDTITNFLLDIYNTDPNIQRYMKHLANSFAIADDIYRFDFDSMGGALVEDISAILFDQNLQGKQKTDKMVERFNIAKKTVVDHITDKVRKCFESMDIKPNTASGWGPDNYQANRILKYADLKDLRNDITHDVFNKIRSDMTDSLAKMHEKTQKLTNDNLQLNSTLNNLLIYEIAIYDFAQHIGLPNLNLIDRNVLYSLYEEEFNSGNLADEALLDNYEIDDVRRINWRNNTIEVNGHMRAWVDADNYNAEAPDINFMTIRGTKKQIEEWRKRNIKIEETYMTIDDGTNLNDVVGAWPSDGALYILGDLRQITLGVNDQPQRGQYFTRKMTYYNERIDILYTEIRNEWNGINDKLMRNEFTDIYVNHIQNILVKCLSIMNLILLINELLRIHNDRLDRLRTIFDQGTRTISRSQKAYLREQSIDAIDGAKKDLRADENVCVQLYEDCWDMINNMNQLITTINQISCKKYMIQYHNDMDQFDQTFGNPQTNNIIDIFNQSLAELVLPPRSYKEFEAIHPITDMPDIDIRRIKIIETFIPQITVKYHPSAYTNHIQRPKIGFLYYFPFPQNFMQNFTLKYGGISDDPHNLDNADDDLLGTIGNIQAIQMQKSDAVLPIIGNCLADHINSIKYMIIRYILDGIYTMLKSIDQDSQFIRDFYDRIAKIFALQDGDYSQVLVQVGIIVENIINGNLRSYIESGASKICLRLIKANKPESYIKLFEGYFRPDVDAPVLTHASLASIDVEQIRDDIITMYKSMDDDEYNNNIIIPAEIQYDEPENKHNIIVNYGMNIDASYDKQCSEFEIDIIDMLLHAGADVNIRDKNGQTPIFDAIHARNLEAIRFLQNNNIMNASVYRLRDRFNRNALDHALMDQESYLDLFTPDVILDMTKKVNDDLMNNTGFKSVMRFNNIILPMAIYLFNHQMALRSKQYIKNWTFADMQRLENLIGEINVTSLPFIYNAFDNTGTGAHETINSEIRRHNSEIEALNRRKNELIQQRNNLIAEDRTLGNVNPIRRNQITYQIDSIDKKITDIENKIRNLGIDNAMENTLQNRIRIEEGKLRNLSIARDKFIINNVTGKIANNSISMHESILKRVINKDKRKFNDNYDFKTYPTIWSKYLSSNNLFNALRDDTQIITHVEQLIKDTIRQNDPRNINSTMYLIKGVYDNIFCNFAKDYFELPDDYRDINYALDTVMKIIIHTVKYTIFVNLYHIILKLVTNHVRESYKSMNRGRDANRDEKIILDTVKGIIDFGYPDQDGKKDNLAEYIIGTIPERIVKCVLRVYENETDPDRAIEPITFLKQIGKRISANTSFPIPNDSQLIKDINDHVIEYFNTYIRMYVEALRNLLVGYLKTLLNQSANIDMLMYISSKALNEI